MFPPRQTGDSQHFLPLPCQSSHPGKCHSLAKPWEKARDPDSSEENLIQRGSQAVLLAHVASSCIGWRGGLSHLAAAAALISLVRAAAPVDHEGAVPVLASSCSDCCCDGLTTALQLRCWPPSQVRGTRPSVRQMSPSLFAHSLSLPFPLPVMLITLQQLLRRASPSWTANCVREALSPIQPFFPLSH